MVLPTHEGELQVSSMALFEGFIEFDLVGAYLEMVRKQGLLPLQRAIDFLSEEEAYSKAVAVILLKQALARPHRVLFVI